MSTPAISTFGRGLKGNGSNQNVQSATWGEVGMTTSPTKFTIFLTIHSGTIGKVFSTGYTSSQDGLAFSVTPTGFIFESNKTENAVLNITADKGDVVITFDNNVYSFYVNTVLVAQEEFIYTVPLKWGAGEKLYVLSYRDSSSFSDALVSNIGVIDDVVLTPDQIEYLHKLPHKFLYPEKVVNPDGSANWFPKSFILPQSTLDKVKVHMPMTDTDGYSRNMVGYSETFENITGDFTTINNIYSFGGSIVSIDNGRGKAVDSINTSVNVRIVDDTILSIPLVASELVKYTFEIETDTNSTVKIWNGVSYLIVGNAIAGVLLKVSVVIENLGDYGSSVIQAGTANTIWIDNLSVAKLSNIYPIQNYTASVRDEAKQLAKGLQTSSWERDSLGVPLSGKFDRLIQDGVGDLNTQWVPDITKDFSFEYVFDSQPDGEYQLFGCGVNIGTAIWLGCSPSGTSFIRMGNDTFNSGTVIGVPYHAYLNYKASTNTTEVWFNGVLVKTIQSNFTTMTLPFSLSIANSTYNARGAVKKFRRLYGNYNAKHLYEAYLLKEGLL